MERGTILAFVGVSLFLLSIAAAPAAHGQGILPTHWQGWPGQPGWWYDPANWTAGVPNEWINAIISNGGTARIDGWFADPTGSLRPYPQAAAASLALGGGGAGTVEQLGGSLKVVSSLSLGGGGGWMPGTYSLVDGMLSAGNVQIDPGPPSDLLMGPMAWRGSGFRQSGGTAAISGGLNVGGGWVIAADGTTVPAEPDEYYPYRLGATYDLAGGALSAGWIYVGYGGKGRMNQSGGANDVAGGLYVGGDMWWTYADGTDPATGMPQYYDPGGVYALSGGWLSARSMHVGQWGRGRVVQTGGAGRVAGTLQIGGNWWWWQTDGAAPPEAGMAADVAMNIVWPGDGVYELHNGEIATGATEIGVGGTGRFVQTGGVHKVAGAVRIGGQPYWYPVPTYGAGSSFAPYPYPGPSAGTYELGGGELRAGSLEVGAGYPPVEWLADASFAPWKPATMRQTGGLAAIEGAVRVRGGLYHIAGGVLDARSLHVSGDYSYESSQLVQTAGSCHVAGGVYVGPEFHILGGPDDPDGFAPVYGHQVYALAGGVLQANHVQVTGVGAGGTSLLSQTGGELRVGTALHVTGPGAAWTVSGGSVRVPLLHVGGMSWSGSNLPGARMTILGPAAEITVTDRLILNASAELIATDGSTIHMFGADFHNYSTTPAALEGLDHLRLVFSIGPEDDNVPETFEVAGRDIGFVRAGFVDNFVLHTLQLGGADVGEVRLVDTFDNQPGFDGKEALYVRNLIIGPGSRLDRNGLNIYYLNGGKAKQFFLGDANLDGAVGIADLSALADHYGGTDMEWRHGDFNGDRIVGIADLCVLADWYGHVGISNEPDDAPVPEPGALVVLAAGGMLLVWIRPSRRRP